MDKVYLLTYDKEIKILGVLQGTIPTYAWFESENEMNDFIEEESIVAIEKLHIRRAEQLQ